MGRPARRRCSRPGLGRGGEPGVGERKRPRGAVDLRGGSVTAVAVAAGAGRRRPVPARGRRGPGRSTRTRRRGRGGAGGRRDRSGRRRRAGCRRACPRGLGRAARPGRLVVVLLALVVGGAVAAVVVVADRQTTVDPAVLSAGAVDDSIRPPGFLELPTPTPTPARTTQLTRRPGAGWTAAERRTRRDRRSRGCWRCSSSSFWRCCCGWPGWRWPGADCDVGCAAARPSSGSAAPGCGRGGGSSLPASSCRPTCHPMP